MALIPYLNELDTKSTTLTNGIEHSLITQNFDYVHYHTLQQASADIFASELHRPIRVLSRASARRKMRRIKPDVVFSKGGFVSVPVIIAANKIAPIIAHESDFSPGIATKISAKFATRVCTSFEETAKLFGKKGVHTGSPIRAELFMGSAEKARNSGLRKGFAHTAHNWRQLSAQAINENIRAILPRCSTNST